MIDIAAEPYLLILMSFLGGLIASVAPCSLAMLPIVVGYIGGYGNKDLTKTFIQMMFFILGMSFVFTSIGLICAYTGTVLGGFSNPYLIIFIAGILMILGLNLLDILDFHFPVLVKKFPQNTKNSIILLPFLIGCLFAFGDSPCATPILAGIISFATLTKNLIVAGLMLLAFSLGKGLILIFAGMFTSKLKEAKHFARISNVLLKASGVLLILSAIFIYYKVFSSIH